MDEGPVTERTRTPSDGGTPGVARRDLLRQIGVVGALAAAGPILPGLASPARAQPVTLAERMSPLRAEPGTRGRLSAVTPTPMAFSLVGFELGDAPSVEFRTSEDGLTWSPWMTAERQDAHGEGPDPDSDEGSAWREMSHPVWVGAAAFIQTRGADPRRVRPHLIDSKGLNRGRLGRLRDAVDEAIAPAEAEASEIMPRITTRAGWGADESWRSSSPKYADPHFAVVHHTVNANNYSASDGPALVRGIYRYHTQSNGWSDIGYNFLVDRYGRAYEGRFGGMWRGVIGAHAGGFNTGSIGVAIIGNFQSATAPTVARDAVGEVLGWKFALHMIPSHGTTRATSRGGTKYSKGTTVTLNRVSGHRDVSSTACPGNQLYAQLADIRNRVAVGINRYGGTCSPGGDPNTGPIWRAAGDDRVATAATVASWYWRGSTHAVIATAGGFADALAGGALAASLDAPILLTQKNELPARTLAELVRMETTHVTLLGGTAAIGELVELELRARGYRVDRLAGVDRFDTAALAAVRAGAPRREVAIASGDRFEDALAAGALLAMDRPPPLLLTRKDGLPEATVRALRQLRAERVFVIDGTDKLSDRVIDHLARDHRVDRLRGSDRYLTSARVVRFVREYRLALPSQVVFTTGDDFPDALTAGAVAARRRAPLQMLPRCGLDDHDALVTGIRENRSAVEDGVIVGGAAAVSDRVRWQLNSILG